MLVPSRRSSSRARLSIRAHSSTRAHRLSTRAHRLSRRARVAVAVLVPAAALALSAAPSPAAAAPKKSTKPVLKISGLSVNHYYAKPGAKVVANDDSNACYTMLGEDARPESLMVFPYVHAKNVPAGSPTTVTMKTPWDAQLPATDATQTGKFSAVLFKTTKNQLAQIFGGPTSSSDFYRYSMLPTGLAPYTWINGTYSITVTTTVKGKPLTASGSITVTC